MNKSVAKQNLTVQVGSVNFSWSDAVGNGDLLDFVYGWNAGVQSYLTMDMLELGEGYWLYAYDPCILKNNS